MKEKKLNRGILFVVSGPSGSGKGTILKRVVESFDWVKLSISATTRKKRLGEEDGVDYHFLSRENFLKNIEIGNLLEYNKYCGNFYGTLKSEVDRLTDENEAAIVEVDVNGAEKISRLVDCVKIFILPPSLDVLKQRLSNRGSETEESLKMRLEEARLEVEKAKFYDYLVENDDFEEAVETFKAILIAEKRKISRVGLEVDEFLECGLE